MYVTIIYVCDNIGYMYVTILDICMRQYWIYVSEYCDTHEQAHGQAGTSKCTSICMCTGKCEGVCSCTYTGKYVGTCTITCMGKLNHETST
jgi:hypothetical protein